MYKLFLFYDFSQKEILFFREIKCFFIILYIFFSSILQVSRYGFCKLTIRAAYPIISARDNYGSINDIIFKEEHL